MSTKSDAACLKVLQGCEPEIEFPCLAWQQSAEDTFSEMDRRLSLGSTYSDHQRHWVESCRSRGYPDPPKCWLYLAKCSVFDGSAVIYKIGVSNHVATRMGDHMRNPLCQWDTVNKILCASRETAVNAEASFLVRAAQAGKWLGGEWVAGCDRSASLLSVTDGLRLRDARYRVRSSRAGKHDAQLMR